jgi:hypothetical protein
MRNTFFVLVMLTASPGLAQTNDWASVQALQRERHVVVQYIGGRKIDGKLLTVDDAQLTLVSQNKPVVIARADVRRVQRKYRDPVTEGVMIGLALTGVSQALYGQDAGWQEKGKVALAYAKGAALTGLVDWLHPGHKTIYEVP